jgi:hypothetical protein
MSILCHPADLPLLPLVTVVMAVTFITCVPDEWDYWNAKSDLHILNIICHFLSYTFLLRVNVVSERMQF